LRQSNIRNEALTRPALERSGRDLQQLRRFVVGEDLFIDRRADTICAALCPIAPGSVANVIRRDSVGIWWSNRQFVRVHLPSLRRAIDPGSFSGHHVRAITGSTERAVKTAVPRKRIEAKS
jgi:hypothetical protein